MLDWEALDMFLQLGYIPAPASPFQDVRKLEPGHTLVWHPTGKTVIERYWHLPTESSPAPPDTEARVREWVDESVQAHLVSDVPIALFLSGGLDSSTVAASMSLTGEPPHAFTARYLGSGKDAADETGLARELANRYGIDLTVVDIEPEIRDIFEPIVWALDEPHADDSAIPTWLLSERVGSSYKVALTGIGGDELFGGYARHQGLPLSEAYHRVPAAVRRLASAAAQLVPEPRGGNARHRPGQALPPLGRRRDARSLARIHDPTRRHRAIEPLRARTAGVDHRTERANALPIPV